MSDTSKRYLPNLGFRLDLTLEAEKAWAKAEAEAKEKENEMKDDDEDEDDEVEDTKKIYSDYKKFATGQEIEEKKATSAGPRHFTHGVN